MNLKPPSQQKGKPASRGSIVFFIIKPKLDFSLNTNLATKFVKSLDGRKRDKNAQRLGQSKHSQVFLLTTSYLFEEKEAEQVKLFYLLTSY